MPPQHLPPFDLLKTWDDPVLISQQPFLDVFTSWDYQLKGTGNTRSIRDRLLTDFVDELCSAGIQEPLQTWVAMASGNKTGHKNWRNILSVFVNYQWNLFKEEPKAPTELLRACRRIGLELVSAEASGLRMPVGCTRNNAEIRGKRKAPVERFKKAKRCKTEVVEAPLPHKSIQHSRQRCVLTNNTSGTSNRNERPGWRISDSIAPQRKVELISREEQPGVSRRAQSTQDGQLAQNNDAVASLKKKTRRSKNKKKHQTSEWKEDRSSQSVATAHEDGSYVSAAGGAHANNNVRIPYKPGKVTLEEPLTVMHEVSKDSTKESSNVVKEPRNKAEAVTAPTAGIKTVAGRHWRSSNQSRTLSKHVPVKYPSEALENPTGDTGLAMTSIQESESCGNPAHFLTYGPAVKPPLPRYPPIWAQSRQEVCESFDWFRSYQGGVYHTRGTARGYLLSAFSARRDIFNHGGKLIISHGGGKAQSTHSHLGRHIVQEADDQLAQDQSVRALLANYRSRRPLVLLIDDRYTLFPYELGLKNITYAVLGFYTIIHAWAEYQPAENQRGRVIRYKFAFQWCESQGEPWWLTPDASLYSIGDTDSAGINLEGPAWVDQSATPFEHIKRISTICNRCDKSSPQVYSRTWTCLNPECQRFWQDPGGTPLGDELEYNHRFIQLAPGTSLAVPVESLEPTLPLPNSRGPTTDYVYTRGWHCKKCGRLSCRFKWEHWECRHCKELLPVVGRVREAAEFVYLPSPVSYNNSSITDGSDIYLARTRTFKLDPDNHTLGQCFSYKLPGTRGFVHHIKAINPRLDKASDEIFRAYQEQASTGALPFRRWPMRAHKCRGQLLTNYFSQNAGVPYQYVGGTENTLSFDEVPDAVVKARNLIQNRIRQALQIDISFNEVLSAAYMERQRMAFHTDDEIGLGPLVAGLSLGSPALMHFRLLGRHVPQGTQRSIAISFVLRHGDILAMDGAGVQQFYEHTVVPTNFRIAATARQINVVHPKREKQS